MTSLNAIAISHLPEGYARFNFKALVRRNAIDLYDPEFGVQFWEIQETAPDRKDREIWGDWPIHCGLKGRELADELRKRAERMVGSENQERLSLFFVLPEHLLQAVDLSDARILIDQCAKIWNVVEDNSAVTVSPTNFKARLAIYVVFPQIISRETQASLSRLAVDLVTRLNAAITGAVESRIPVKLVDRCLFLDQRALENDDPAVSKTRFLALRTALNAVATEREENSGEVQKVFNRLKGISFAGRPAMLRVSSSDRDKPFSLADPLHSALRNRMRPMSMAEDRAVSAEFSKGNLEYLETQFQQVVGFFTSPSAGAGVSDEVIRTIDDANPKIVSKSQKIDRRFILEPDWEPGDKRDRDKARPDGNNSGPTVGSAWNDNTSREIWYDPDISQKLTDLDENFRSNITKTKNLLLKTQKRIRKELRDKQREVREAVRKDWETKNSEATETTREQILENISQAQDHRLSKDNGLLAEARSERLELTNRFRLERRRDAVETSDVDDFLGLSLAPVYLRALEGVNKAASNLSERGAGRLAIVLCALPWLLYTAVLAVEKQSGNLTAVAHNFGIALVLTILAFVTFWAVSMQLAELYRQAFRRFRDAARQVVNEIAGIPSGVRTFCARAEASAGFKETERLYRNSLEVGKAILQREAYNQLGADGQHTSDPDDPDYSRVAKFGPLGRSAETHDPHQLIVETLRNTRDVSLPEGSIKVLFREEGGDEFRLASPSIYNAQLEIEWAS